MKKLFVVAAILCCSVVGYGQERGEMYLGGTLDLSLGTQKSMLTDGGVSESVNVPMSTSFGIGAEYAYFAAKNLRLALAVSYDMHSSPTDEFEEKWYRTNTNVFQINPNIAYYVRLADRFYYTPEIGASFGFGGIKAPLAETSTYRSPYFTWDVYANIVAFEYGVSPHFALGCSYGYIGYGAERITSAEDKKLYVTNNTFIFDLGTAGVSARYYF